MQSGLIDVHAHLIPGIDDGCATLEQSLACGRMFVEAGYTHAFCTPHVWPNLSENTASNIARWTTDLQRHYDASGIALKLLPGGEINLQSSWPTIAHIRRDEILSYSLQGKYVLFDFWSDEMPDFLLPAVEHLLKLDLVPVMAHPERVRAVQQNPTLLPTLMKLGMLLQCNTWCLMDRPGLPTRDVSERLLREGKYFLLGTDTHKPESLPIRFQGVQRAIELVGERAVYELTVVNPRKLLPDDVLAPDR